jgi:spoIIIJ-associated protein
VEDGVEEFSARTVDAAVEQAEAQLGVSRDALDIEVVTQGSRGVFGIGAENARIRVRRPEVAATRTQTKSQVGGDAPTAPPVRDEIRSAEPSRQPADEDLSKEAQQVLSDLLQSMGFQADVEVRKDDDPVMLFISGDNLGVLIGRRGDNLAALQFMVNLILSKNRRQWPRVVIDVENYRARREESLRSLADRIAYRVQRNQRAFTLEAMSASDRRIIHLSLRDRPDIETYSIGEGPSRRVVVAPKRTAPAGSSSAYS